MEQYFQQFVRTGMIQNYEHPRDIHDQFLNWLAHQNNAIVDQWPLRKTKSLLLFMEDIEVYGSGNNQLFRVKKK